jgi:hypothetical protein
MPTCISKLFFTFTLVSLVGCVQPATKSSDYSRAPNNAYINVLFNENGCPTGAPTITKTCPFVGKSDPVDTVCQEPSTNNGRRKITWEADGDVAFTLEFKTGSPLTSTTTGRCKLATAAEGFTCLVRKDSELPSLTWVYKYDVVVNAGQEDECRLDPRVYLMH